MKNKMSAFTEKIQVLKNIANQKIEDCISVAVISFYMGLFYWTMLFHVWILLLTFWKPKIAIFFLLYACWIYYDRNTPRMGGRKSKWFSNLKVFSSTKHYFSTRLIKTADLPAGRNYLLAHYPHGMLPFHILPNLLNNSNKAADLFPGIEMQYVTTDFAFYVPFLRDFFLLTGGISCSESSFTYSLRSTPSKGIIVLPGGASEIKYTMSGSIYRIIKRKGFVRLALATGTPLVPVFTFGDINAWTKVLIIPYLKKSRFRDRPANIIMPIGRGLLPKRTPVNTIVGAPIPVPKVENPSQQLIDEYQEIFFQALQDLFEQYKHEYDTAGEKAKLIMV